jgi:hypothetical protein
MRRRMDDQRKARPVSGEIMAGARQAAGAAQALQGDIVDADYEVIAAAAPAGERPAASVGSAQPPLAGMDMLRRPDDGTARFGAVRGSPIFWIFGMTTAAAAFWVAGGHALMRELPFAGQATAGALRISGVTSRVDASARRKLLLVDGEAANDGGTAQLLPPLDIMVTGDDGLVTRYRLGTSERSLRPGETFAFSSRLDVPKNGVKTVSVAFGD